MQHNIEKLLELLNKEIETTQFGKQPKELYEPIDYILGIGGKRIRPLLTLMSAGLFSGEIKKALKPALAVEVFHNFTLMHDDIMDGAPLRRGKATVHKKWDNNVAILSGDVMLIKAYQLLMHLEGDLLKETLTAFSTCAEKVCEGQQFDMNYEKLEMVTEEEYLNMIHLKTAALIGLSLELGGIISGTENSNKDLLRETGNNIGLGFQLMDDLLDVYGDHEKFGKQVGGDIAANKKTFLTIKAFELAKGEQLEKLKKNFSRRDGNNEEKIKEVKAIYDQLNIKQITEEKINFYFDEGLKKLSKVDAPMYKKAAIKELAKNLLNRDN